MLNKIKSLLAFSVVLVLFNSCAKELSLEQGTGGGPKGTYYFRFKLDGVQYDYSALTLGFRETFAAPDGSPPVVYYTFTGKPTEDANDLTSFGISLTSENIITTGNYAETAGGTDYILVAMLTGPDFSSPIYAAMGLHNPPASAFVLKLTTLTDTEAGGTFSGSLYSDNGLGNDVKMVTDGEFYVKFY
ncbi:MAG TPA: hypothetical protein VIK74_00025 [Parasegetibacter sp.]